MTKLNPRVGIPLVIAVVVVALASFAPGLAPVTTAQARACQSGWWYGTERVVSTYLSCIWDFGCWLNPMEPNGEWQACDRICADKYDRVGYCGTDCWDECWETGDCCNY
jgi:hypothetical protein